MIHFRALHTVFRDLNIRTEHSRGMYVLWSLSDLKPLCVSLIRVLGLFLYLCVVRTLILFHSFESDFATNLSAMICFTDTSCVATNNH